MHTEINSIEWHQMSLNNAVKVWEDQTHILRQYIKDVDMHERKMNFLAWQIMQAVNEGKTKFDPDKYKRKHRKDFGIDD